MTEQKYATLIFVDSSDEEERQDFIQKKKKIPCFSTCSRCETPKITTKDFHIKRDSSTGYNTVCKTCVNTYGREWKLQRKIIDEIVEEADTEDYKYGII